MNLKRPNSNLDSYNTKFLNVAYDFFEIAIDSIDNEGNIDSISKVYSIIIGFSIIREISGIKGKMDAKNINKMASFFKEDEEFIKNIVLFRNVIAHPFDGRKLSQVNFENLFDTLTIKMLFKFIRSWFYENYNK